MYLTPTDNGRVILRGNYGSAVGIYPSIAIAQRVMAVMQIASAHNQSRPEGLVLEQIMCAACGEGSQTETDDYGQVIIYTNLKEEGRDEHNWPLKLVAMTDADFGIEGD